MMNEIERVIAILKDYYKTVSMCLTSDDCEEHNKAIDLAINALEKQIPKKIYHRQWVGIDGVPYDLCPTCRTNLCTDGIFPNKKENYCGNCGQKLDWSYKHNGN